MVRVGERMTNPLAINCQQYKEDSGGKVVGVQLGITPVANSHYEVYSVRLRDEYEAQGNTVARCKVLDKNNVDTGIAVRMAWAGRGPQFQDSALPGNPSNEHFVPNKYWPPELGPLALFVGAHNAPQSDIVYGVGLPKGHHVSFDVVFKERGTITPPPDPDPIIPPINELAQQVALNTADIARIKAWIYSFEGKL